METQFIVPAPVAEASEEVIAEIAIREQRGQAQGPEELNLIVPDTHSTSYLLEYKTFLLCTNKKAKSYSQGKRWPRTPF